MKRILFVLITCALLGAPALAVPSLGWWDRDDSGATYQEWTFDDNDNPAEPEIDENPYGVALATMSSTGPDYAFDHRENELGRCGVWTGDPLKIEIFIPNRDAPENWKEIWLEIAWRGSAADMQVDPIPGGSVQLILQETQVVDTTNLWYKSVLAWRIVPNPDEEIIEIIVDGTGGAVDYIAVDTICIPAPGAILLGSIGAGLVGWLRRRRTL